MGPSVVGGHQRHLAAAADVRYLLMSYMFRPSPSRSKCLWYQCAWFTHEKTCGIHHIMLFDVIIRVVSKCTNC